MTVKKSILSGTGMIEAAFAFPIKAIGHGASRLINGRVLNQTSGAKFAKAKHYREFLGSHHKGLLVDGHSLRLSKEESAKNICVIARTGAGKTSRYIIPNVLDQASRKASLVINDPKGDVFQATSGAMHRAGFKIITINPQNPQASSRFNPLSEARDDIELEQIAAIIVRSGNPGEKDGFWNLGATRIVAIFLKALRNVQKASGRPVLTLENLNFLFQNFGSDGSALTNFMANATIDPDDPSDPTLWNEWKGALTGNEEGVQSFVLNGLTALRALSNRNIAWMTSASDFKLDDLRREKTCIYFITPPQHGEYFSTLVSIFFRSVFNSAMRNIPSKSDLPISILYDEFGHANLPDFVSTANTIRAYKCSLSIVLQSISQLSHRYGSNTAAAIQGGFNTFITYPGSDPHTAQFFEQITGKVRERQREEWKNHTDSYREYQLINSGEIRTLDSDQALIVSANRDPMLIKTKPYFLEPKFSRLAKIPPVRFQARAVSHNQSARITL